MEKVTLTFLGTGSAIPTKRRSHPAMLLQYRDENILVDCGEGTQRQMRIAGLNPCKITKILISHWHVDHVIGLPGLLQTLMMNNYNRPLQIYGPKGTQKMMDIYLSLFVSKTNQLKIQINEIDSEKFFESDDFLLEAEEMEHDTISLAYAFVIKEKNRIDKKKLRVLKIPNGPIIGELARGNVVNFKGKKIDGKKLIYHEAGKKITFIMDTRVNSRAQKIAKDSDLLISESSFSNAEKDIAPEYFHLTGAQAAEIAKKSNSKKLILTHISQRYEANPKVILEEAKKVFKNTILAEDFMKIDV
jgi:ribonuclease Z